MTRDSRKPWAVLAIVANSRKVMTEQTRYFWTQWGARRYAGRIGDGAFYQLKAVRN